MHVLIVEDLPSDAELAERELKTVLKNYMVQVVDTEEDFIEALKTFKPDLIISDYQMPVFDGLSALRITREKSPMVPFVMLTGAMHEDTVVDCMKAGADDYVIKEHIKRLGSAVLSALEKKRVEVEYKQSEGELLKLSTAVTQSPSVIVITDLKGNLEYVNPKFTELTGYTVEEAIGQSSKILKSGEQTDEVYKELWETISSGKEWRGEFHNKKKNGELFWESVAISPIVDKQGKIINYLKVAKDITENKKAEAELIAALIRAEESDRLKSAFLANMSHEIRTPMNSILGFLELLKEPGLSGDEQQKYISIIEKSGDRMLNTINDIVEITKLETCQVSVTISEVSISQQFEELRSFFKPEVEKKGLQYFSKDILPESEFIIKTDMTKLFEICSNLINNAIKYTDNGSIEIGCKKRNNFIEFFVKDTGIGIAKDRHQTIFDRFVQADQGQARLYEGSGLGLSISKAYVELLGGEIWVESEEGEGSVFYFTIPLGDGE